VYHSPYHALPDTVKAPACRVRSLTIHDMIPVLHPEWFGDTTPFRKAMTSLRPGDVVLADSECTRSDAIHLLGLDPAGVHVAYPGISPVFTALDRAACRQELPRLGIPDVRFLLAVGTLEPRKNLPQLLDAFARLSTMPEHADLHLVLTGARGWKNELFDRVLGGLGEARSRVILTGYMEERDLPVLYGACEVFAHPSLYEGFGLPIAEAMASGAAVVCARNSSQTEVAGDVAGLADAHSSDSIATALARVLADPARLDAMRRAGPAQAGRFTWKACVDAYLEAWRCA
jgi:glycosyltransferase involved in cell wall biosynthesis